MRRFVTFSLLVAGCLSVQSCTIKSRACDTDDDCFVGEVCTPAGECAAGSNGDLADTGPVSDAGDEPDDTSNGPSDLPSAEDSGGAEDGGGMMMPVDAGSSDVDSPPDETAPWRIAREVELSLPGSPTEDVPAQVAMFGVGFLAGYHDGDAVHLAWYTLDAGMPIDGRSYAASVPTFDLAGALEVGYAVLFEAPRKRIAVEFTPSAEPPVMGMLDEVYEDEGQSSYEEISIAMEGPYGYTGQIRTYNGTHVDLGVYSTSYYVLDDRLNYEFSNIEALGGGATGQDRRVLITGVQDTRYQMLDFQFDDGITEWSNIYYDCGTAPAVNPRIAPIGPLLALTRLQTPDGPEFSHIVCANVDQMREALETPTDSDVVDFGVAKESTAFDNPAVVWLHENGEVWFGRMSDPAAAPALLDAWRIPTEPGAVHVRSAFNIEESIYGVVVQYRDTVKLFFLERT